MSSPTSHKIFLSSCPPSRSPELSITPSSPTSTSKLRSLESAFVMAASLSTLKATQLQSLNRAMGLTFSGTKPILIDQLRDLDFRKSRTLLSIDMGVRNLAYCVVTPPKHFSSLPEGRTFRIDAWRHETLEVPNGPTSFAVMARNTVTSLLQKYPGVDTILIERQRWRSGGGSAVQQHTIHCNIFESMLHACFLCLMDTKYQVVQSVDPRESGTLLRYCWQEGKGKTAQGYVGAQ